ncbi:hypothetical protein QYZ59_16080 [Clostridium perfringens]|uniref:hypothetical protein n=2 Tax=Clostridium perfringens TaxID=1502 RepID=UPI0018E48366|nr:hypothetical protein [Clostridium perfringens]MDU7977610.1 hypothetical protein [Clostridioides difficile]EGT0692928.1 hypothetical protein [Clostridium perfringens]EGT0696568.1 hypothetical protein [Clostridium perfringens]MBI6024446.1 hypothetical protein [Clostridium perfringens]MBI6048571.1 hypothetical protein [Clostridium perfringens]
MGTDMYERKVFDEKGKTFYFRLDQHTCCKCKSGICSLDEISLEELVMNYKIEENQSNPRNSTDYCRTIAGMILRGEFKEPAKIIFNKECGHYSFDDGQHRTCCISKLKDKGVYINKEVLLREEKGDCYYCGRLSIINKKIKLFNEKNFLYRIRYKKKIKELITEKQDFDKKFHLWKL